MTEPPTGDELLARILAHDRRYRPEAYAFVSEALGYTVQHLERSGHVTGRELCYGLRLWALRQFGPLAGVVLATWGIHQTEDIGEIVFNMVEVGLLRKTDEDSRADFRGVFDLAEALGEPWRLVVAED